MDQIKVIISDGDSQEIQQIDNAIKLFLPKILRIRCGWHMVFMGWKVHMPSINSIVPGQQIQFLEIQSVLKNWMYSWMKSSCETRTEFLISKKLFLKYISTDGVTAVGLPFTEPLLVWYRNSIETLQSNFFFT